MIIVSQDRTEITNFNNINVLRATKEGRILSFDNAYNSKYDCSDILGKYKTEERAKEVLQEIYKFYEIAKRFERSSNNRVTIFTEPRFAYSMPEE